MHKICFYVVRRKFMAQIIHHKNKQLKMPITQYFEVVLNQIIYP